MVVFNKTNQKNDETNTAGYQVYIKFAFVL